MERLNQALLSVRDTPDWKVEIANDRRGPRVIASYFMGSCGKSAALGVTLPGAGFQFASPTWQPFEWRRGKK